MIAKIPYYLLILTILCCFPDKALVAQPIVINEIMASNAGTLKDEDGDYPDWIELYNRNTEPVSLNGWSLSDSPNNPMKWLFPDLTLQPSEFLLVFASGKDRRDYVAHWETIIDWGDEWKYFLGKSEPPADWNTTSFDDSAWLSGISGFGYGDGDDATIIEPVMSIYIRKEFFIEDLQTIRRAILHMDYDDAFVAYLNGSEFARANIGQPGIPPRHDEGADNYDHEALIYRGLPPERFDVENWPDLLKEGSNVLAIQVHNHNIGSSDMTCIPFFSLGMTVVPADARGPASILNLNSPGLHTNFKISASGETITLSDADSSIQDQVNAGIMPADFSFGRQPDGAEQWLYFDQPTPGSTNVTQGYAGFTHPPEFSLSGGFYFQPMELSLSISSPQASIYYSLDGTDPDTTAAVYAQPIPINSTTVVRARAFAPGLLPSPTITHTYFMNHQSDLPVISISTTPSNLWDTDSGIYVLGNDYNPNVPHWGANFWQDWERPAHVEMYENDGTPAFAIDAGIKIHGGWSRARPQKSLSVFARSRYGYPSIEYALFPDLPFTDYSRFILRNAANDWDRTMFADGMIQNLARPLDLEIQAFRPAVVYINGEYFGIHNIREKMNDEYLEMHHGVAGDQVDMLEGNGWIIEGDNQHYNDLLQFISSRDMTRPENMAYVETQMEVDNYIDYQAFQIYIDNRDWPGNNIKFWRPKTETGRWRWLLYDTEWGFGINAYGSGGNAHAYTYNTLAFAISPTQTPNHHGNPPWSTYLLRSLLQNEEFKYRFINRFADHINSIFNYDQVIGMIDSIETLIAAEMRNHYNRWKQSVWWSSQRLWWSDFNQWYYFTNIMRDFAKYRSGYMISHVISQFNLSGTNWITLEVLPQGTGTVRISSLTPDTYPWKGLYFRDVPIRIEALPAPGYQFKGWSGDYSATEALLHLTLTDDLTLKAQFEAMQDIPSLVVINEINYNSAADFNAGDWIELYYPGESAIDLSGWLFRDDRDDHVFRIPDDTWLAPGDYLVICRDSTLFRAAFPTADRFIGNFDFGLSSSGDQVRIFNDADSLIDFVEYGSQSPWPVQANGGGSTLELKNPRLDNSLAENWSASTGHGTPGRVNSVYTPTRTEQEKKLPEHFVLYPNYPNPFNPVTTISYTVGAHHDVPVLVDLSIYNLLGQKVATLVSAKHPAGKYEVQWDASGFSSGVYFYQLSTDQGPSTPVLTARPSEPDRSSGQGFVQTKKMVLLR